MECRVGIDNGVSGAVAIIIEGVAELYETPTVKVLNYTKKKGYVNRIDVDRLKELLGKCVQYQPVVKIERPMVNPGRFKASVSAIRALEATCIALEQLGLGYEFVDSKEWQKEFLPSGVKGSAQLKEASTLKGIQMFPYLKEQIEKQKDADALFIALI